MRGYGLLHCIGLSWNVRGIALADLGSFLDVLQHEFNWSFLCIQELTKAVAGAPKEVGGHRIFACPSKGGREYRRLSLTADGTTTSRTALRLGAR